MMFEREGATFRTVGASRSAIALMSLGLLCVVAAVVWLTPTAFGPVLTVMALGSLGYASGYRKRRRR
jgi:formate hydrogenlyase subunit 4